MESYPDTTILKGSSPAVTRSARPACTRCQLSSAPVYLKHLVLGPATLYLQTEIAMTPMCSLLPSEWSSEWKAEDTDGIIRTVNNRKRFPAMMHRLSSDLWTLAKNGRFVSPIPSSRRAIGTAMHPGSNHILGLTSCWRSRSIAAGQLPPSSAMWPPESGLKTAPNRNE